MNTTLRIDAASETDAANQAPTTISAIVEAKLDEWLMRLVAVPPGQSPLAYGLAIGMRIALFILVPLGIIASVAILLPHRVTRLTTRAWTLTSV
jgi:hypothetical protein